MKPNDRILLIATAAYSYLFYEQNAGINFLVFTLLLTGIFLYRDRALLYQKKWLLVAAMALVSAISVFIHSSALAVIANIFSLLLLSAFSFNSNNSFIAAFAFSCYSLGSSFVHVIIDAAERFQKSDGEKSEGRRNYMVFTQLIVVLLCILFFVIYRSANPLFAKNTDWINLEFINVPWLLFTSAGFFIVYGLYYHKTVEPLEEWESSQALKAPAGNSAQEERYKTEASAGITLFVFLNVLLVILNVGDINTIWLRGQLPEGIAHSDFVHNGVGLIILSILIATGLIMFVFRQDFGSSKNTKLLKLLVYAWIAQNVVMLISTGWRNQIYIHDYNLTHKRVGVYVWLVLAVIGLLITTLKVKNNYSNWYLVKTNVAVWFCCLALSSTLDWDLAITRYNLRNKPLKDVDFYYLFSLSETNLPELLEITHHKDFAELNGNLKNYTDSSAYQVQPKTYNTLLLAHIRYYLKEHKNSWQSCDLRDKRIMNHLIRH